jgi:ADP-dependent NAD(P)H-hydrate dehydratase
MIPADLPRLARRKPDSHKGLFGTVLIAAGGRGMTGAAVLAGLGALRGGAGRVRIACPADAVPVVAAGNPCYMVAALPTHADGTYSESSAAELVRLAEKADVFAAGPGLGNRPDVGNLVRTVLTARPDLPAVLDADALNVLSPAADQFPKRPGPVVLTPHPSEFARLLGTTTEVVQADRERLAREFAARYGVVVLLKGTPSIVTDGVKGRMNETGNPGMATGGTGDVLTGLVAALIGQKMSAYDAACLGAWVHGRAGDFAAAELSEVAMTAADLPDYLPKVFKELG